MTLKEIRIKKGYTIKDIAAELNVSVQSVCLWEKGKRRITPDKLLKLSKFYKMQFVKLAALIYGEKETAAVN